MGFLAKSSQGNLQPGLTISNEQADGWLKGPNGPVSVP